ncbi:dipeptidase PepE [Bacteroidota bacterium]
MRLLLLSNSTNFGEEYLEYPRKEIQYFLGEGVKEVIFIPYAGVTISYDEYTDRVGKVFEELGYSLIGIHTCNDPLKAITNAESIAIGGGNTFELLNQLYQEELIEPIKVKVHSGIPFMGWSAGSNMACPSIMTTNDMPIAQPPSFTALDLIPFQINPHYTEGTIPNHGGESRNMRIEEFLEVNRDMTVVGLTEGMIIKVENKQYTLIGEKNAKVFKYGMDSVWVHDDVDFNNAIK